MPSPRAEEASCPEYDGLVRASPQIVPSELPLLTVSMKELTRECDRTGPNPELNDAAVNQTTLYRANPCNFQRARLCLLGESHHGFRKSAGTRER